MKLTPLIIILLALAAIFATTLPSHAESNGDGIIAVVNDSVITRQELMDATQFRMSKLDPNLPQDERRRIISTLMFETLQTMIDDKLITAKATKMAADFPKVEGLIQSNINNLIEEKQRTAGGAAKFNQQLKDAGLTYPNYIEKLRAQQMQEIVLYEFVFKNASVSPDEILDYYQQHTDQFTELPTVKYQQIYIRNQNQGSKDKAQLLANKIKARLLNGEDFTTIAKAESNGARAADGGVYDFERQGLRPKPVDKMLFHSPIEDICGPADIKTGFVIVRITDRTPGKTETFEEAQPKIKDQLTKQKRNARFTQFLKKLREENYVEILDI